MMYFCRHLVTILFLSSIGAALEIFAPGRHQATVGSPTLIPCNYTVANPPLNPNFFAAFWHFKGELILSYNNEVITTNPRYSLDKEKALSGRVDLSISEPVVSDAGVYSCTVIYSPMQKKKDIIVYVEAKLQMSITANTLNEESVLRCSVTGFYPVGIDIKWFKGQKMLSDVTMDEPQRNSDGTYSITVTIPLTKENREQNFSCRVQHKSLQDPLQEDYRLIYKDKMVIPENVLIAIIISSIVGGVFLAIVLAIVLYYVKKEYHPLVRKSGKSKRMCPGNNPCNKQETELYVAFQKFGKVDTEGKPLFNGSPEEENQQSPLLSHKENPNNGSKERSTPETETVSNDDLCSAPTLQGINNPCNKQETELYVAFQKFGKVDTEGKPLFNGSPEEENQQSPLLSHKENPNNGSKERSTPETETVSNDDLCSAPTLQGINNPCNKQETELYVAFQKFGKVDTEGKPLFNGSPEEENQQSPLLSHKENPNNGSKERSTAETEIVSNDDLCSAPTLQGINNLCNEQEPELYAAFRKCGKVDTEGLSLVKESPEEENQQSPPLSHKENPNNGSKECSTPETETVSNDDLCSAPTLQGINNPCNEQEPEQDAAFRKCGKVDTEGLSLVKESPEEENQQSPPLSHKENPNNGSKERSTPETETVSNDDLCSAPTLQGINNPCNEQEPEQDAAFRKCGKVDTEGLSLVKESPEEENKQSPPLSHKENPNNGSKECSTPETETVSNDDLCSANRLSVKEDDDD